jgi:hypothetical protein
VESLVGAAIVRLVVQVLFYGVERRGELGDVCLEFADRRNLLLGCAGHGGVLIRGKTLSDRGAPPFTAVVNREVPGVHGKLASFLLSGDSLELLFEGGTKVDVSNDDDELRLHVNGEAISEEILSRT